MRKKVAISLVLGIIISGLGLYLAFRNVPFSDLIAYLIGINYWWLLPATAVILFSFVLRTLRWQIILGVTQKLTFRQSFHPLMIGFMVNCILPGRVGEVARPLLLKKREKIPFTTGLATVAAERVFDIVLLIGFMAVILATIKIDPSIELAFGDYILNRETLEKISSGMLKLCVTMIVGIFLISFQTVQRFINHIIMECPHALLGTSPAFKEKIRQKICTPLKQIIENIATGLALAKHPKRLILSLVLSFLIWFLMAFSYYVIAMGCPGISVSFLEMMAVLVIICIFIALPSVPGFWGLWEAGGVFALSLFGIGASDAAGFTLVNHFVQVIPVIIIGLISTVTVGVNIVSLSYENAE